MSPAAMYSRDLPIAPRYSSRLKFETTGRSAVHGGSGGGSSKCFA
jgi:hypothetical protein